MLENNDAHPYIFDEAIGCWRRSDYVGINYSDGNETEEKIKNIVLSTADRSTLSDELRLHCTDWPTSYHLSGTRANILRPFADTLKSSSVLEIGAGCGAITRFLGETGARVTALEGSLRRASIARQRTIDLSNVEVLAESFANFQTTETFDCITLIGVLEYANLFVPGAHPGLTMLRMVSRLLKENGTLFIAIENKLGLKYFAGAPEDHVWKTMYGIEGRYRADQPSTYGAVELVRLLDEAGMAHVAKYAPFPDYKFPYAIVTESGAAHPGFDAASLASQHTRKDSQLPAELVFSPERVWPEVCQNDLLFDLSNSFLFCAQKTPKKLVSDDILAYNYSTDRKSAYCKEAIFSGHAGESIHVLQRPFSGAPAPHLQKLEWLLKSPKKEDYHRGTSLQSLILDKWKQDDWVVADIAPYLDAHVAAIKQHAHLADAGPALSIHTPLPGHLIDLTLANLISTGSSPSAAAFDQEWKINHTFPLGWLLFRSYLILMQSVTRIGTFSGGGALKRIDLMKLLFQGVGFSVSDNELDTFAHHEAGFLQWVVPQGVTAPINWYAQSPIENHNALELLWYRNSQIQSLEQLRQEDRRTHELLDNQNKALSGELMIASQAQTQSDQQLAALHGQCAQLMEQVSELHQQRLVNTELETQLSRTATQLKAHIPPARKSPVWKLVPRRFRSHEKLNDLDIAFLVSSPAFDADFYLATYPDLPFTGREAAARHFHIFGWRENRKPAVWFDCESYLLANPDVLVEGLDPFVHFLRNGVAEKRRLHHTIHSAPTRSIDTPVHAIGPVHPDPYLPDSAGTKVVRASVRIFVAQADADHYERCRRLMQACEAIGAHHSISLPMSSDGAPLPADLAGHRAASVVHAGDDQWLDFLAAQSLATDRFEVLASISTADPAVQEGTSPDTALMPPETLARTLEQAIHLASEQCALLRTGLPFQQPFQPEPHEIPHGVMHDVYVKTVENPSGVSVPADVGLGQAFFANSLFHKHFLRNRGDLAHFARQRALESLVLYLATARARDFRSAYLAEPQRDAKSHWFELQHDFRPAEKKHAARVLAFYLPQFRPTPENDAWHGKGFTEWYKVRSASPLFAGHYQQHIPHPDIGYYAIEEGSILRKQANMLKAAGMEGLVFYHYWFSGKLILEKAAQILLADTGIDLPFCFCWANENWTKRWDGEDQEVLLAQNYSPDDARAFIDYLIPFFKDHRYIRVNNRPVLIVYRPSSMEMPQEYIRIWGEQCRAHGLEEPYVVATLTRGAASPAPYAMDAALERPLNDWTDGAVPDIRHTLQTYTDLKGSALDYSGVADFYSNQAPRSGFTYLRSVVPVWDNTPRYKSAAYLLHDYSNVKFQHWLTSALEDTSARLPQEEQILVVNAWNEWAEGAHLEPDEKNGYAYLNAVGRALTGQPYFPSSPDTALPLAIRIHPELVSALGQQPQARSLFLHGLRANVPPGGFVVSPDDQGTASFLDGAQLPYHLTSEENDPVALYIDAPVAMPEGTLAMLATCAQRFRGYRVVANHRNDATLISGEALCMAAPTAFVPALWATTSSGLQLGSKVAAQAHCYRIETTDQAAETADRAPSVSTLTRFHSTGSLLELRNAIYSLLVHTRLSVEVALLAQDLDEDQRAQLDALIRSLPLEGSGHQVSVHPFSSDDQVRDLRCVMLNRGIALATHPYVTFLDYDDTLFPGALTHLARRLADTGARATFGRVYHADLDDSNGIVQDRRINHGYGSTYDDFFQDNCAPIHSFMLDKEKLDLDAIRYFPDMKFMEDYYFLLQVFDKDNTDWASLNEPVYLGDYNFRVSGKNHTLVFRNEDERQKILADLHYQICQHRIDELRQRIKLSRLISNSKFGQQALPLTATTAD